MLTREMIVSAYIDTITPEEKIDLLWHYIFSDKEGFTQHEMEQKILRVACEESLDFAVENGRERR